MRMLLFVATCSLALAVGRSAMLAAPGQTQQPGQMTRARVWSENRGRTEAIPISLQDTAPDAPPLRVRVVNTQPTPGVDEPVSVRIVAAPVWQYQTVTIRGNDNVAALLSAQGASGWETTGVALPTGDGTVVVMKRPRQQVAP